MDQKLFRKESLEKISSPDQLNQYIRVSGPGAWLILAAAVILLAGACVWGVFGRLETAVECKAVVRNGRTVLTLGENQRAEVREGMTIKSGNASGTVILIPSEPSSYDDLIKNFSEYDLYSAGIERGEWTYPALGTISLADGVHDAQIVIDGVSPFSFLTD